MQPDQQGIAAHIHGASADIQGHQNASQYPDRGCQGGQRQGACHDQQDRHQDAVPWQAVIQPARQDGTEQITECGSWKQKTDLAQLRAGMLRQAGQCRSDHRAGQAQDDKSRVIGSRFYQAALRISRLSLLKMV